jgi:hypothetical protein
MSMIELEAELMLPGVATLRAAMEALGAPVFYKPLELTRLLEAARRLAPPKRARRPASVDGAREPDPGRPELWRRG